MKKVRDELFMFSIKLKGSYRMKVNVDCSNNSLTEHEVLGLSAKYNLADGHSYISAKKHFDPVLKALPEFWDSAMNMSVPEMERLFKNKFSSYFHLNGLASHDYFSVCPTASNSIDIVGAWARSHHYKVGLVEPTFDNLAQLLKRREVTLQAIPEPVFNDIVALGEFVKRKKLDVLFMVNPNNPTGGVLEAEAMSEIIEVCREHDVVLVLDTSFRFCRKNKMDEYALLIEKKLPFIILEDTGKQWPTLDTKASLLSYSQCLAKEVRCIYEELYLCSSNFSLGVINGFIDETQKKGGLAYIQSVVEKNRALAKSMLEGLVTIIEDAQAGSIMSVMWLDIECTGLTDLELIAFLADYEVAVLPGRYFYWNSHDVAGHNRVRIALLKPDDVFGDSIARLKRALEVLSLSVEKSDKKYLRTVVA